MGFLDGCKHFWFTKVLRCSKVPLQTKAYKAGDIVRLITDVDLVKKHIEIDSFKVYGSVGCIYYIKRLEQ